MTMEYKECLKGNRWKGGQDGEFHGKDFEL